MCIMNRSALRWYLLRWLLGHDRCYSDAWKCADRNTHCNTVLWGPSCIFARRAV